MGNTKSSASKHLGQLGSYAVETDIYDPTLLVAIPRNENREPLGITGNEFIGYDVWHCHEATFLLDNGLPLAGTLKIVYSSNSVSMVESKSFKLYLNSFDMYQIGTNNPDIAVDLYCELIKKHLSELLDTFVAVSFFSPVHITNNEKLSRGYIDLVSTCLEHFESSDLQFTDYKGSENHLKFIKRPDANRSLTYKYFANNLRSRCHITSQKDTGNALITIITKEGWELSVVSLLKQIVSIREINEFHENCAEKLYNDIMSTGKVRECSVILLYARRGSLDINPIRVSSLSLLPTSYLDTNQSSEKEQNQ